MAAVVVVDIGESGKLSLGYERSIFSRMWKLCENHLLAFIIFRARSVFAAYSLLFLTITP